MVVSQRVRGGRFSRIYTGCWPSVYQTHWIWSVERQSAGEVGLHTDCKILYKFLTSEKTKQYLEGLEEHANEGKRQCEHNSVPSSLKNKYCTRLVMLKWVKRNDLHTSQFVLLPRSANFRLHCRLQSAIMVFFWLLVSTLAPQDRLHCAHIPHSVIYFHVQYLKVNTLSALLTHWLHHTLKQMTQQSSWNENQAHLSLLLNQKKRSCFVKYVMFYIQRHWLWL